MDAARQILSAGSTPLRVRERSSSWLERLRQPIRFADRIGLPDIALFSEQLAEMLKAGVTVEHGLDLLARQSSRAQVSRLATRLLEKIRAGSALSQALTDEVSIPRFYAGLIRGAERGGRLADGLGYLGDYLMRQTITRNKIIATLTYPAVVIVTATFALFFVLVVVIPEFVPLFAGEENNLPLVTRLVLWLSTVVTTKAEMVVFASLCVPASIWFLSRHAAGLPPSFWLTIRRLPPVDMAVRLDVAKTIRVLGALLASGVDASEAAALANESAASKWVKSGTADVSRRVREGVSLSEALKNVSVIPPTVITLIAVGERTGEVGQAALRAASLLEVETNRRIDQLISVLNPIAVVLLGGMVAVLISGVMLGILSANQFALR
jgi:type II secretory pathway component PulF